jgi:hypothetical protein
MSVAYLTFHALLSEPIRACCRCNSGLLRASQTFKGQSTRPFRADVGMVLKLMCKPATGGNIVNLKSVQLLEVAPLP